jgi:hypothetical protein
LAGIKADIVAIGTARQSDLSPALPTRLQRHEISTTIQE